MKYILGTMTFDYPFVSSDNKLDDYIDIVQTYINNVDEPILDSAYYYGNTKTEQTIGMILPHLSSIPKITTKANPWYENDFTTGILGQLSPEPLEKQLTTSITNMGIDKVDVFYLHCPDYETDIKVTLDKSTELWRREKFNEFGISNFSKDQLINILELTENEGYVFPTYYQGMYNIICRKVEELFPILQTNKINFRAYNPLAGGLLTGKYKNKELNNNSRFKNNEIYKNIFWKDEIVTELDRLFKYPDPITISYKWIDSKLSENDGLIIGASNKKQLLNNIQILNSNYKLVDEIDSTLNNINNNLINYSPNYYY